MARDGQRYKQSDSLLEQACRSIPLGSQTFTKSKAALPKGVSPFFAERAEGATLWDVDGHAYTDYMSGLLSISLGYQDPDVNEAVQKQLLSGVNFSLPHRLEVEVAEQLIDLIPCAEQVRFGKNGTDVTSAAVRIARAYTGRDHIAVCGYHGWQDWYIGSTSRNLGVPDSIKALTHTFSYNKPETLKKLFDQYPNQIAAVVMEPMTFDFPREWFLENVKKLCEANGTLLVFDEMITGFRFALGGAQSMFGVTPHLAAFGKGMANGFPLSALVGQAEMMRKMEDIFFSGTFGGEALSLAAAKATMIKMRESDHSSYLVGLGERLFRWMDELIKSHQLTSLIELKGHPSWTLLNFKPYAGYDVWKLKTYFMQECFANGILIQSTHNLSGAHTDRDLEKLVDTYGLIFPRMKQLCDERKLSQHLHGEILQPVFTVRPS